MSKTELISYSVIYIYIHTDTLYKNYHGNMVNKITERYQFVDIELHNLKATIFFFLHKMKKICTKYIRNVSQN